MSCQAYYHQKLLVLLLLLVAAVICEHFGTVDRASITNKVKRRANQRLDEKKGVYRLIDILRPVRAKRQSGDDAEYDDFFFFPYDLSEGEDYDGSRKDPNGKDPHDTESTSTTTTTGYTMADEIPSSTLVKILTTNSLQSNKNSPPILGDQTTASTTDYTVQSTDFRFKTLSEIQAGISSTTPNSNPEDEVIPSSDSKGQSETAVSLTGDADKPKNQTITSTSGSKVVSIFTDVPANEKTSISTPLSTDNLSTINLETTNVSPVTVEDLSSIPPNSSSTIGKQNASVPQNKDTTSDNLSETSSPTGQMLSSITNDAPSVTVTSVLTPSTSVHQTSHSSTLSSSQGLSQETQMSQNGDHHSEFITTLPSQDVNASSDIAVTATEANHFSGFTTNYDITEFSSDPTVEEVKEFVSSGDMFQQSGGSAEVSGGEEIMYYTSSFVETTQSVDTQGCFNCGEMKVMMEEFAELKRQNRQLQVTLLELSNTIAVNTKRMEDSVHRKSELVNELHQNFSAEQKDVKETLEVLLEGMENRLMGKMESLTNYNNITQQQVPSVDTVSSRVSDLSQCVYHTKTNQSSTNHTETFIDWSQKNNHQDAHIPTMQISNAYCVTYGGTSSILQRTDTDQHQVYTCVCSGKLLDSAQRFCELHIWECPL